MTPDAVTQYLADSRSVEGWFFPIDAQLFGAIDEIQKSASIAGNLFEIGVHHGKTALLLARFLRQGEVLGVCDVFGRQELNVDHSGHGDEELFRSNLARIAPLPPPALRIFARSSATLSAEETTRECRFFHIDGGHRPEDVISDLETADRAVHERGVIVVDDVFNPNWPGVAEGFFRALPGSDRLAPLFIGGNKVFLTRPAAIPAYEQRWADMDIAGAIGGRVPFRFERKGWLGREVWTAIRSEWVDLDPAASAAAHAGIENDTWRMKLLRKLLRVSA